MVPLVKYSFNSLDDYLISKRLSVDGEASDGAGANFAVKGREIEAALLFADISSFSSITLELSSTETLIFVNNFFTWITAEALKGAYGIIDKYIGDEIMVVFSEEFGSNDPFMDAVTTARRIAENDYLGFCPHIGIACGIVTVGYVGTPLKYDCSVFGKPVTLAARCTAIKIDTEGYGSIVFPAELWKGYSFEEAFGSKHKQQSNPYEKLPKWKMHEPQKVEIKNMPALNVICIEKTVCHFPTQPPHERAREILKWMGEEGLYNPQRQ